MKFWTADVGLIRVVVRRGAPSGQRIAIRRLLSRARSVRTTFTVDSEAQENPDKLATPFGIYLRPQGMLNIAKRHD